MRTFIFCLFLFANQAHAATEFSGHWQGMGLYQSDGMLKPVDAEFDLVLAQSDSRFTIDQCWTIPLPYPEKKTSCYHSDYEIRGEQVFARGKKIGDIFPKKISLFQGNSQVSELMGFELHSNRELRFRYSYSNFDGELTTQYAQLPEMK